MDLQLTPARAIQREPKPEYAANEDGRDKLADIKQLRYVWNVGSSIAVSRESGAAACNEKSAYKTTRKASLSKITH